MAFTGFDWSRVTADHSAMASKTPPSERLAEWLGHQRWFATKTRRIEAITIEDVVPLASAALAIVGVGLDGGAVDRYVVALGRVAPAAAGEVTRFLTEHTRFAHAPRLFGQLEYRRRDGGAATLAVVHELIPGARDGWEWLLDELRAGRPALDALRRLGEVTGHLHRALASGTDHPDFAPEP